MNTLPIIISVVFLLITIASIFFIYRAGNRSTKLLVTLISWTIIQSILGIVGVYQVTDTIPPRFLATIIPPIVAITIAFNTKKGRGFINSLQEKWLLLIHSLRIPVELVLLWLATYKVVPTLMTFEGRNFDILSGISALILYFLLQKGFRINRQLHLAWNFICLGLLINIVAIAILSAPFPFQKFAFDQPNIAVLYFPFNLLPAIVVPLVLFSHIVSIRRLLTKKRIESMKAVRSAKVA